MLLIDPFAIVQEKEVRAGILNMPIFQVKEDQIPYHQILNTTASGFKIVRLWQDESQHISSLEEWKTFQKNYRDEQIYPNEYPKNIYSHERLARAPRAVLGLLKK